MLILVIWSTILVTRIVVPAPPHPTSPHPGNFGNLMGVLGYLMGVLGYLGERDWQPAILKSRLLAAELRYFRLRYLG